MMRRKRTTRRRNKSQRRVNPPRNLFLRRTITKIEIQKLENLRFRRKTKHLLNNRNLKFLHLKKMMIKKKIKMMTTKMTMTMMMMMRRRRRRMKRKIFNQDRKFCLKDQHEGRE